MIKKLLLLLPLLLVAFPIYAQTYVTGRWIPGPAGQRPTCSATFNMTTANTGDVYKDTDDAGAFACAAGTWGPFGGGGGMVYPAAGIAVSNGSSWLPPLQVGTSAGNLVQVQAGSALPALSAVNLTNYPTFNQNTTGNAATATNISTNGTNGQVWSMTSGSTQGWATPSGGGGSLPTETQYCAPYYATTTTLACVTAPTTNGLYGLLWNPTAGVAVPLTKAQFGVNSAAITGSQTSLTGGITYADVGWYIEHDAAASGTANQALPTATTLGNPNFKLRYINFSAQTDTITPTTWTIAGAATLTVPPNVGCDIWVDPNSSTNWLKLCNTGYTLPTQYTVNSCQGGWGDGLNAIPAGTYLQSFCYNDSGVTRTITHVRCASDNNGTTTLNGSGNTLGALLTGAVTCTNSFASGTQSANVALTNGDYIKFTMVADGTTKQVTYVVTSTE